jgi:hypothetical protein
MMAIKNIIKKKLNEHHDIIRHDSSIELLRNATESLADAVRYLECLTQELDHKECNDVIVKVLDMIRHPMGSVSDGNFDEKNQSNIISMLEMISSIVGRTKDEKVQNREISQ